MKSVLINTAVVHCTYNHEVLRPRRHDAETYYIFYYSRLFTELAKVPKLLKRLEAAVRIELTNKGFAVRPGRLSLSVMECHRA